MVHGGERPRTNGSGPVRAVGRGMSWHCSWAGVFPGGILMPVDISITISIARAATRQPRPDRGVRARGPALSPPACLGGSPGAAAGRQEDLMDLLQLWTLSRPAMASSAALLCPPAPASRLLLPGHRQPTGHDDHGSLRRLCFVSDLAVRNLVPPRLLLTNCLCSL